MLDKGAKLDTSECIYCRIPKREPHAVSCPRKVSRWSEVKTFVYCLVVLAGWALLFGGFYWIAELIVP
jgi:hypothetical protein